MHILVGFILIYFIIIIIFKSGFTPWADIVNKILVMQTIGQVVEVRMTNFIRHEVLITK